MSRDALFFLQKPFNHSERQQNNQFAITAGGFELPGLRIRVVCKISHHPAGMQE